MNEVSLKTTETLLGIETLIEVVLSSMLPLVSKLLKPF